MCAISQTCFLCGQAAQLSSIDRGNGYYVACSSEGCGDYEMSVRAARDLVAHPHRKTPLQQHVLRANAAAQVLRIVVGSDGLLQAVSRDRSGLDS